MPQSNDQTTANDQTQAHERRRAPRATAPMTAVVGSTPYTIDDWNTLGIKIVGYYGNLKPDDRAELRVLVPTAGPGALFNAKTSVRRYDEETAALTLLFDPVEPVATVTLNRYLHEMVAQGCA
ncbi:hypothetical protein NUH88_18375 [Nisaea acidiphila]|uniref:PilZ domain-containing protein n=1 Tax=Nisaea acidiphila TaxID=1862145 RepID=A0A9J7AS18_9PROT|nr:hypothetical protein [Nisaea acidiphila]UUX49353.1 hypothetical protein NUH88_18375 [Nisaea acidiphila]